MLSALIASLTALSTNVLPIAEISRFTDEDVRFVVDGTVIGREEHIGWWHIIVRDASGRIAFRQSVAGVVWSDPPPATGDVVRCHGFAHTARDGRYTWFVDRVERRGRKSLPEPPLLTADELFASREYTRPIRLRGVVRDAFFDELDPNYIQIYVHSGGRAAIASINTRRATEESLRSLLGREVEIYGFEQHAPSTATGKLRHYISANSLEDVRILPSGEPVPDLEPEAYRLPSERLADLGLRRLEGRVLASWTPGHALLRAKNGRTSCLELLADPLPRAGDRVAAIGLPVTDLYNVNLAKAVVGVLPPDDRADPVETPLEIAASSVLRDERGRDRVRLGLHGRRLKMTGRVRHLRQPGESGLYLETDGRLVLVDTSANPKLLEGIRVDSVLTVTGVCVLNIDNRRPDAALPKIIDFKIVPSRADDLAILSSPSWWTPPRAILLTTLLSLALGVLAVLNRLSKKVASLRYAERTRLAIELHDSIAQSLAGISMQVDAAGNAAGKDGPAARLLKVVSRSLDSCRTELRNCLWDLRNNSLEERDFAEAIRTAIRPFADEARIRIRFTLPHDAFSDGDRHAVLSIVRELASNAIRHGKARTVRIAGCRDARAIIFAVRDDGTGFDPATAAGVGEGHFGLQGIRERVKRTGGTVAVNSHPGRGTRVKVRYGK